MRTQQTDLYCAEKTVPYGCAFVDLAEVRTFVRSMLDAPWWHERFPCVRGIHVTDHPIRRGSVGGWFKEDCTGQIEMSPAHWDELSVCHEVAHVCANSDGQSHGHDPVFARTYLELVYRAVGTEAWQALRVRGGRNRLRLTGRIRPSKLTIDGLTKGREMNCPHCSEPTHVLYDGETIVHDCTGSFECDAEYFAEMPTAVYLVHRAERHS